MKPNTALAIAAVALFGLSACQMGGDRSATSAGSTGARDSTGARSSEAYPSGSTSTPSGRSPGQGAGNTGTATTDTTNDPNRPGRGAAGATPGTPSR